MATHTRCRPGQIIVFRNAHVRQGAQEITDYLTGFVRGEKAVNDKGKEYHVYQGRAEFVANMRERMLEEGFGKVLHDGTLDPEIHDNDLRDLRGCRRLQLILTRRRSRPPPLPNGRRARTRTCWTCIPANVSSASVRSILRARTMMPLLARSGARTTWRSGLASTGTFAFRGGRGASIPGAAWRMWTGTRRRPRASSSPRTKCGPSKRLP